MESTRHHARKKFLRAIGEHAPRVLKTLSRYVFPCYKEIIKYESDVGGLYSNLALTPSSIEANARFGVETDLETEIKKFNTKYYPVVRLQHVICKWARQYNLVDEWCINEALQTLILWRHEASRKDWAYTPEVIVGEEPWLNFSFLFKPWDVETVTWSTYQTEIKKEFLRELHEYRKHVEEVARLDKIAPVKSKHGESDHHFMWLAQYQCRRFDLPTIANCYDGFDSVETSTIHDAIKSTASMIGLTLRKAPRGRPHAS
jgi:hypothetical protein